MPEPAKKKSPWPAFLGLDDKTLRAKPSVTVETVVRMTWDHQENQDNRRSARLVSVKRGDGGDGRDDDEAGRARSFLSLEREEEDNRGMRT